MKIMANAMISCAAVCGLAASAAAAEPRDAKKGPSQAPKPAVLSIDTQQASLLWHAFTGMPIPDAEMLGLFKLNPKDYNEFERRRVVQRSRQKLDKLQTELSTATAVYALGLRASLGEYDFSEGAFPVVIPDAADPLRIGVGKHEFASDDCPESGIKKVRYLASVNLPTEGNKIAMGEDEAEKLMPRFGNSVRTVDLLLAVQMTSAWDEQPSESDPCEVARNIETAPITLTLSLPAKTSGATAYPQKTILKWAPAPPSEPVTSDEQPAPGPQEKKPEEQDGKPQAVPD